MSIVWTASKAEPPSMAQNDIVGVAAVGGSVFLVIGNLAGLQLQLELIGDQGDEFGIRGFSLGIGNRVAKEPLEGVQIASVPSHLDGVADGALDAACGGLVFLCH